MNNTHEPPTPQDAGQFSLNRVPVRALAIALSLIVGLASVAYGAASVHHLFSEYVGLAGGIEPPLAALSTVGLTVALLLLTVTTGHQNTRAMCGILILAWLVITIALVATDSALRAQIATAPEALIAIGRAVAAILPALALLACVLVALAMHDRDNTRSAAAAAAHYIGFGAKLAGIGASTMASAYFGIQHRIDPALAVFLGVVLESCFVWGYLSMTRARERRDRFDVFLWSLATLIFGGFIAAVSVETVSSLTGIDVPVVSALGELGASLYVSAIGLSLALTVVTHLLTRAIDMPASTGEARPRIRILRGVAGSIAETRAGLADVRAALTGDIRQRLPEPAPATATGEPASQPAVTVFGANGHSEPAGAGAPDPKSE